MTALLDLVIKFPLGEISKIMSAKKTFWFWAWIVLGTVQKNNLKNPKTRCEVWENLVVIRAANPKEAFQKAEKIGKQSAGDARGTLQLFSKPARQLYLGIQNLGVIHEPLEDGAEIIWNLKQMTFAKAKNLVRPKTRLLQAATKEFSNVSRN